MSQKWPNEENSNSKSTSHPRNDSEFIPRDFSTSQNSQNSSNDNGDINQNIEQLSAQLGTLKLRISECPGAPNCLPYYRSRTGYNIPNQHELFIGGILPQIKFMPKEYRLFLRSLYQNYLYEAIFSKKGAHASIISSYKPTAPICCLDEEELFYYGLIPLLDLLNRKELLRFRVYVLQNFYKMLSFLSEGKSASEIEKFLQNFQPEPRLENMNFLGSTIEKKLNQIRGHDKMSILPIELEFLLDHLSDDVKTHPTVCIPMNKKNSSRIQISEVGNDSPGTSNTN